MKTGGTLSGFFHFYGKIWMVCACTKDRGYFTNRDDKLLTMPALTRQLCRGRLYGPLTIAIIDCVWYAQATSMLKSDIFITFFGWPKYQEERVGRMADNVSIAIACALCPFARVSAMQDLA